MIILGIGKSGGGEAVPATPPSIRGTTSGQTSTITLPTRVSGDLLILFVNANTGTSSTPSGWTLLENSDPFAIYSKVSDGSEAAPSFPILGSNYRVWSCHSVQDCSGVEASDIATYQNSTLTRIAPSLTAGNVNRLLLVAGAYKAALDSGTSISFPGSMTTLYIIKSAGSDVPAGTTCLRAASETIVSSGATGTRTVTFGANNAAYYHAACSVLLQPN